MEELQILSQAIQKWGSEAQIQQVLEEMGELIVALNQYRRGRVPISSVHEEIADVLIMAEQLAIIFGYENVKNWRIRKINRLRDRIKSQCE